MKFCQDHWDRLRQRIDDRGLSHLIAADGQKAVSMMTSQLQERRTTRENYDPLMGAHFAILNNAMCTLENVGINPLLSTLRTQPATS